MQDVMQGLKLMEPGRAIHIIQNTLPDFFSIGLVTRISNEDDNASSSPKSSLSILSKTIPSLPHLIGTDKTKDSLPSAEDIPIDEHNEEHDLEPIYSPKVKLVYSPPDKLPPPFPETLRVEGESPQGRVLCPIHPWFHLCLVDVQGSHSTSHHPRLSDTLSMPFIPISPSTFANSLSPRLVPSIRHPFRRPRVLGPARRS